MLFRSEGNRAVICLLCDSVLKGGFRVAEDAAQFPGQRRSSGRASQALQFCMITMRSVVGLCSPSWCSVFVAWASARVVPRVPAPRTPPRRAVGISRRVLSCSCYRAGARWSQGVVVHPTTVVRAFLPGRPLPNKAGLRRKFGRRSALALADNH